MSKYHYNKEYFKTIDTPEKAYWLGFLYADGCITRFYKNDEIRSMSLEITLCHEDRGHLEKFAKSLEADVPISNKIVRLNGKEYLSHRLVINYTAMCRDLINLGCTPAKTYDLKFPTFDIVPYEFMRDFIRGFFDGDGCICVSQFNNKPIIIVSFTGMPEMLHSIADFLISERVITSVPSIKKSKSKAYDFRIYGIDHIKVFLDYIYKDSELYLDRKYKKYKDFYKDYSDDDPIRGVYWSKHDNKYLAAISTNGKKTVIGRFTNVREANEARRQAEFNKMNEKLSPLNQ